MLLLLLLAALLQIECSSFQDMLPPLKLERLPPHSSDALRLCLPLKVAVPVTDACAEARCNT